jgi:DUF2911 family protein
MYALALVIALVAPLAAHVVPADRPPAPREDDRASFVTTLGRDTVAVESFTSSATKLEGDLMVRVPGTVLFHYVIELGSDGALRRTMLETDPLNTANVARGRVTIDVVRGDSVRITTDSAGNRKTETRATQKGAIPWFMTGFGSSFGLYTSLAIYDFLLPRLPKGDTITIPAVAIATGRTSTRQFVRRSPTLLDADYFRMAWTHLTLDAAGHIASADAIETTEQTKSQRVAYADVKKIAKDFASRDKSGKGLGVASPNLTVKSTIAGTAMVLGYGSPRKRDRVILGTVVPYDKVWRTGANEATVIVVDRAIKIGTADVPAGAYSLWTVPKKDGSVTLIINRQHGQWGTEYHADQDLARVAMQVTTAQTPRENFTISLAGTDAARELRIEWDTFVWTVPILPR